MGRHRLPQSLFDALDDVLAKHHGHELTDEHFDLDDETCPRDLVPGMEWMPESKGMDRVELMFLRGRE